MTESTSRPVDLSTLSDKQLAKEYKSIGKGIKSKDPEIKADAFQKIKDVRYFTHGGCLVPLVESLVPKKKLSDENRRALDVLDALIGQPLFSGSPSAEIIQKSLQCILNSGGNLEFLRAISDLTVYKEIKAGAIKKSTSIDIPLENESAIYFRNTSLKALCSIVASLSSPNKIDRRISESFASVPTLFQSICLALENLRSRFDDKTTRDGMIQEGIWGLVTLIFILKNKSASIGILLPNEIITVLLAFSAEESLSLYCLQIFELISHSADETGITYLTEQLVLRVTDALQRATDDQDFRLDTTTTTSVGALTPAGKGKEKLTKKAVVVEKSERVGAVKQSPRQNLACIKVAASTIAAVCVKNGSSITGDIIPRIVSYFAKILNDKTAWELAQSTIAEPFDIDLSDVFDECCICLGSIGLIGAGQRRAVYEALAMPLIFSVLQNSMAIFDCVAVQSPALQHSLSTEDVLGSTNMIKKEKNLKCDKPTTATTTTQFKGSRIPDVVRPVGSPEEEAEKLRKVRGLRRVAEMAAMILLSERKCDGKRCDGSDVKALGKRWHSAVILHEIDITMFVSSRKSADREDPSSTSSPSPFSLLDPIAINNASISFPLTQLMEMIASVDIDLGNRGMRILSSILEGLTDPFALMPLLDFDAAAMTTLANTVQNRMIIMMDAVETKKFEVELQESGLLSRTQNESKEYSLGNIELQDCFQIVEEGNVGVEADHKDTERSIREKIDGVSEIPFNDVFVPSEGEGLYCSLVILERLLAVSAININIFCTKDRLRMIAALLYRCGATANQKEGNEMYSPVSECEITLFDPRNSSWSILEDIKICDTVQLRPLLFDILGLISNAEEKYRVKEGEISNRPSARGGAPIIVIVSPCKESSLCVGKLCGDAVISTLLVQGRYSLLADPNTAPHMIVLSTISNGDAFVPDPTPQLHVQTSAIGVQVLDSALGCLLAMISSGATSLYAVLESVADAGFSPKETKLNNSEYSPLHRLKVFLSNLSPDHLMSSRSGEGSRFGDDQMLHAAASAELKTALSQKSSWTRSLFFDHLFPAATFTLSPSTILKNPVMWPYITICASVLGVISSVDTTPKSVIIALDTVMKLCKVDNISDTAQPVIADSFATFFLAMGGAAAVAGALGRFGTLRAAVCTTDDQIECYKRGLSLLIYLTNRGRDRELYWLSKILPDASSTSDPKGTKAKEAKAAKEKLQKEGKRGKSFLKLETVSIVEEIMWNHEPDGSHPDPNHGPTRGFWRALLETRCNELHTHTDNVTVLIVALQGGLPTVALGLIREGAGVHISDVRGISPLMYSLFLGDQRVADALITAGADVDAVDGSGTPTVTYACHSMLSLDVEDCMPGPIGSHIISPTGGDNNDDGGRNIVKVLGNTALMPLLLSGAVDVCVCNAQGNSPLLSAIGLGEISVIVGGYTVISGNNSFSPPCSREETLAAVSSLLAHGACVNACNLRGVVPLHIAAARGHLELIELLKQSNAIANAEDEAGFLPLHYLAAGCPSGAEKIFSALMEYSRNRVVVKMVFSDVRTGKSKAEKYVIDVSQKMKDVFEASLRTSSLGSQRFTEEDLIKKKSNEGLTVTHVLMAAHALNLYPFESLFIGDKYDRMNFLEYLIQKYDVSLLSDVDDTGMSAMHCASLLFHGITPQRVLNPQEIRSKRVKSYPSLELKLLDIIVNLEDFAPDCMCTRLVPLKGFTFVSAVMDLPSSPTSSSSPLSSFCWTPLHGAIARDNVDLFDRLVELGGGDKSTFNDNYYSHFLAVSSAGSAMCEQVVGACSSISAPHNILLNSTGGSCYRARPLHLATRSSHSDVVKRLLKCSKVDPNLRDEVTGMTAVHEACKDDNLNILSIFGAVSDRLDLLMTDFHGKTCIDIAIERKNVPMLKLLVKMRRNDVLERVLHARHSSVESPSILVSLELENIKFAESLGYVLQTTELADGGCVEEKSEVDNDSRFDNKILSPAEIDVAIVDAIKKIEVSSQTSSAQSTEKSPQADNSKFSLQNGCITDNREVHREKSLDAVAAMKELLSVSNQIVKILIVAAFEAGITDSEFHAHPCYSQGALFTEHVRVSQV